MFIINLTDILQELGRQKVIETTVPLKIEDDLFTLEEPVRVTLTITALDGEVLVQGLVQSDLLLRCSRCNELYPATLEAPLEEEFYYEDTLLQLNEADKKVGREELKNIIDPKGNIDLEDALRQVIVSELPLKQICQKCHDVVQYKV